MSQMAPAGQPRVHLSTRVSLGERAVVLVLAAISLVGLVIARAWPVPSVESGDPTCLMRILFNLPCPGCGMTRAWVHTAHGNLGTAFEYNLFGPIGMAAAAGLVLFTVYSLVRRRPPERLLSMLNPRWLLALIVVWLVYSVIRMISLGIGQDYFGLVLA